MERKVRVFTGPETMKELQTTVPDGWIADGDSYGVTFAYPYPNPDEDKAIQTGAKLVSLLPGLKQLADCDPGEETKRDKEDGALKKWFTLQSEWPVSSDHSLELDVVGEIIQRS